MLVFFLLVGTAFRARAMYCSPAGAPPYIHIPLDRGVPTPSLALLTSCAPTGHHLTYPREEKTHYHDGTRTSTPTAALATAAMLEQQERHDPLPLLRCPGNRKAVALDAHNRAPFCPITLTRAGEYRSPHCRMQVRLGFYYSIDAPPEWRA